MTETNANGPGIKTAAAAWPLMLAAVWLAVFGAKAMLIASHGGVTPYWDQWHAEADLLYKPYLDGTLSFGRFFESHNEHRILLVRLLALSLLEFAGEWRPLLQMVVNAALHAGFAVLLAAIGGLLLLRHDRALLALVVGLVFALPIGWENTLAGFQSQFYFLLIFSTLAVMAFARASAFSPLWWGGTAACVLTYFAMASGALAMFAACALVAAQMLAGQRGGARELAGLAVMACVGAAMVASVTHVSGHDPLKAQGIGQWVQGLTMLASWPLSNRLGLLIVQAPLAILAVRCLAARAPRRDPAWGLVGLGLWLALQMASLAYGRAVGLSSSRYLDIVLVGLPLNFMALVVLLRQAPAGSMQSVGLIGVIALWLALVAPALVHIGAGRAAADAAERGTLAATHSRNVAAYLAGDRSALRDKKPYLELPYSSPQHLAELLDDPTIRGLLPRELRPNPAAVADIHSRLALRGRLAGAAFALERASLRHGPRLLGFGVALFVFSWILMGGTKRSERSPG